MRGGDPSDSERATGNLPFASATGAGVRLAVRLTPRAARDGVAAAEAEGRSALRLRVAAPPVDGAANAALGLRTSDMAIVFADSRG